MSSAWDQVHTRPTTSLLRAEATAAFPRPYLHFTALAGSPCLALFICPDIVDNLSTEKNNTTIRSHSVVWTKDGEGEEVSPEVSPKGRVNEISRSREEGKLHPGGMPA